MTAGDCPSIDALREYALGKNSAADADSISRHIKACPGCLALLGQLNDSTDSLVADLRRPASMSDTSQLLQAIGKIMSPSSAMKPVALLQSGTMLREYRIIDKIGAGGMGVVYRALHTRLEKEVALKVIGSQYVAHPEAIARFGREMKAAGRFQHPNIVQATDAGDVDGMHYLVMEFVPGTDLSSLVRHHGPMNVTEACDAVAQAANGLQHAHDNGMVHRDVKPSNLMRMPDGTIKILDLGLALLRDDPVLGEVCGGRFDAPTDMSGNELTTTSHMLGTNDYMAPEQTVDAHAVDARADVYSLGCTLLFLLTGRPPERGMDGEFRIRAARLDIPRELEYILQSMLAFRPDDRLASARDVAAVLSRYVPARHSPAMTAAWPKWAIGMTLAVGIVAAIWLGTREFRQKSPGMSPNIGSAAGELPPPELLPMPRDYEPRPPLGELPMAEAKAKALQKRWGDFLKVESEPSNSIGMRLALIPPGDFFIRPEEKAQVRITRPFYMGVHEVTRKQFGAYISATRRKTYHETIKVGSWDTIVKIAPNSLSSKSIRKEGLSWRNPGYAGADDDDPATHIIWTEAVQFCEWLSNEEKQKYRLPTDAEWEWAARAGVARHIPEEWLSNPALQPQFAWDYRNSGDRPHPVGLLNANAWGLKDCLGNVREWCSDWYGADAPGLTEDPKGPIKGVGQMRVVRGFDYRSASTNLATREGFMYYLGSSGIGFRVVREIPDGSK